MFIVNTFLGFLIAQISDILTRNKKSSKSPKSFSISFFLKDTWQKILLSLLLSFAISIIVHLNFEVQMLESSIGEYESLVYAIIGAVPEWVLQKVKKKIGFVQPSEITSKGETYNRL